MELAEKIKSDWVAPKIGNLHWDGKLVRTLNSKYDHEERLPVLVSGIIYIVVIVRSIFISNRTLVTKLLLFFR